MTFEDQYKHELDSKEKLRAAVGIPLGLLVVIGGFLGTVLQSFWFETTWMFGVFCIFGIASGILFAQAAWCLMRSYHEHNYKGMPLTTQQLEYRNSLRLLYLSQTGAAHSGDAEFEAAMEAQFAEAATHNALENLAKSEYLFKANQALIYCVISTICTFIPFAAHKAYVPAAVQKIEIVNTPKLKTLILGEAMPAEVTHQPSPKPAMPKPQPPPLRDLREGEIPKRK